MQTTKIILDQPVPVRMHEYVTSNNNNNNNTSKYFFLMYTTLAVERVDDLVLQGGKSLLTLVLTMYNISNP